MQNECFRKHRYKICLYILSQELKPVDKFCFKAMSQTKKDVTMYLQLQKNPSLSENRSG